MDKFIVISISVRLDVDLKQYPHRLKFTSYGHCCGILYAAAYPESLFFLLIVRLVNNFLLS